MADDKERGSRVRGSSQFTERRWGSGRGRNFRPYRIGQVEWINRLNYVRRKLGDSRVAELTGVSVADRSFKTVRRWTTGERVPSREVYEAINTAFNKLQAKDIIPIRRAIDEAKVVKRTKDNFASKVNYFENALQEFGFVRRKKSPGITGANGFYTQCVNKKGEVKPPGKRAIVFISTFVEDSRKPIEHMECRLIIREDSPSPGLLQNAIETFIEKLPEPNDYLTIAVSGVWFSYV